MKDTPEGRVKALIKQLLFKHPVWYYMPIPSAYGQTPGLPDFCCILQGGHAFFIEAKAPGKRPTRLQMKKKDEIERVGATWFLVDGPESLKKVEGWLNEQVQQVVVG